MNKKPLKKNEVIKILKSFKSLLPEVEKINIIKSNKRILSKDIVSSINVPPFKNSAVDGYAIRNLDIDFNYKFQIVGKATAGDNLTNSLKKNEAVRIFTGALMPNNADTVVMQENAIEDNDKVSFLKKPKKNENCRLAGEDILKNQLLFKKGSIIKSYNQSILASIGLSSVNVFRKLSVGFFTSGDELESPTQNLIGSQINNSNKYTLINLIKGSGFFANDQGILKDNFNQVKKSILESINNFDVIITTGGASVGDEDYLIKVMEELGNIIFWKTAIKPGRPLAFGLINQKPIICLPGNPVSVFLLFGMLIKPLLFKIAGAKWKEPNSIPAKINFKMKKKTARMEWLRVCIDKKIEKELVVNIYPKQGSGIISSIAFSDGIIEIPEDKSELNPGDIFKFYPRDFLY